MLNFGQVFVPLRNKFTSLVSSQCEPAEGPSDSFKKWDSNWDMRQHKGSQAVRQIVLIRHGQYEQGVKGDENKVLTALGREQAARTGKRLRELIDGKILFPVRSIHYSTMARATETYSLIRPELPPMDDFQCKPCSMIREGAVCRPDPPSLQWKPSDESFTKNGLAVEAAFTNYFYRASPKDSIISEASDMKSSLSGSPEEKLLQEDPEKPQRKLFRYLRLPWYVSTPNLLFILHERNVIRYFVMRALQLPPEAWLRTAVYNASITVIHIYPSGRVSLYSLGDVGHLPPDKITYN